MTAVRDMTLAECTLWCARNMVSIRFGYQTDDFVRNRMHLALSGQIGTTSVKREVADRLDITTEELTAVLNECIREYRATVGGTEELDGAA
jgi:hypothetical protein